MKFINFNNHKKLDVELFQHDKNAALTQANAHLTKSQLDAPSVAYSSLEAGYIIAEKDEIIIDTDDLKATTFIKSLLTSLPESYAVHKTKKGYHWFIKLAEGHGLVGKRVIKFKELKIELMGEGTWVFGGSRLADYYKTESNLNPDELEEFSDVDSAALLQQLLSLGDIEYKSGALKTNQPIKPYSMPRKQAFLKKILDVGSLTPTDYKEFEYLFRYALGIDYNPYKPAQPIAEGTRNNTLLKILTDLSRCADCEDVRENLEFLSIVARDFCEPSYDTKAFEQSFNMKRFQKQQFQNFTKQDFEAAICDSELSPIDIALDLSPDSPTQNPYYLIKTNEHGEEELQPIGRGDRVLRAEIMNDTFLSKMYMSFNPKSGKASVDIDKIPTIRIDNRTKPALSPFEPLKKRDRNVDVFDMASQHYTRRVRNVRSAPAVSEQEFWELPIVKMALENLYPSKDAFEYHMAEFYRVFNELSPTNKVFTFLGSGGIGKDTWFDFLSFCFIENFAQIYKKSQCDFLNDKWGYADCASMIILSEAGDRTDDTQSALFAKLNRVVGNQKVTIEKKFAAPESRDVCLFSAMTSSNNTALNIQDYNNTRVVVLRCPERRVLRNNKENQRYFFGDKNLSETYEDCADKFVAFILNNSIFFDKWKDVPMEKIDSSAQIAENTEEVFAQNETIQFIDTLSNELKEDRVDTLVKMCEDPDNLVFKQNPKLKRFAFRIYCNFIMALGADPEYVRTFINSNEFVFDVRHDRRPARLYGIANTLRMAYRDMSLIYNLAQTQSILHEKIMKQIVSADGKWNFSEGLKQRYIYHAGSVKEDNF